MRVSQRNNIIKITVVFMLLFFFWTNHIFAQETAQNKAVLLNTVPVTSGAVSKAYRFELPDKNVNIYVMEIDLNDPYVRIDSIPGAGRITNRASVSDMAKRTGAVIAINGDFFNTQGEGAPIGPMITSQIIASSPSRIENTYALGITADKKAYISQFAFSGKATAPDASEFVLSGINKTFYWEEPSGINSHSNKLHLYNDLWGSKTRGNNSYATPTEMLIKDNTVISIIQNAYFDFEVPEGTQILRGHGLAAAFIVEKFKPGDTVLLEYAMEPDVDWGMVIGGHGLLVDEGKAIAYTRSSIAISGSRSRSAAGISQDGRTLYLIGAEGGSNISRGFTIPELSAFLEAIGVYRAVNLDGGGSSTLVARELGNWDVELVYPVEQAEQRLVPNAIGVYTDAPASGPADLIINGETVLLLNEIIQYEIKAYDKYYNPVRVDMSKIIYSDDKGLLDISQGDVRADRSGSSVMNISFLEAKKEIQIEVVGKDSIKSFNITPVNRQVNKGSIIPVELKMSTMSGREKKVDPSLVDWQFYGFDGFFTKDGMIFIEDVSDKKDGFAVARYQGFSAPLPLIFSNSISSDIFNSAKDLTFQVYPQDVKGSLSFVHDNALKLSYDFSKTLATAAAYIKFAGDGLKIEDRIKTVSMDIQGNMGNEWIRAEVIDAKGMLHRIDIVNSVDWIGWRTVELNLTTLMRPVLLNRVYVVCPLDQRGARSLIGDLYFKSLSFNVDNIISQTKKIQIEITLGQKEMIINEEPRLIDIAPVVEDSRTLVPVRFISEALGAEVLWRGEDKKVTVIRGSDWIDLWAGEKVMAVSGRAVILDVEAKITDGRVMIPLRAVAEALGLLVNWDPETKSIRLYYNGY